MKPHYREILLFYDPDNAEHRKTVAHAQSLVNHLKPYSFDAQKTTNTSWKQILDALDAHPKELFDKSKEYYQEHIRGREFDDEGWLNVLNKNFELIQYPIAMRGHQAVICRTPSDVHKLDTHT